MYVSRCVVHHAVFCLTPIFFLIFRSNDPDRCFKPPVPTAYNAQNLSGLWYEIAKIQTPNTAAIQVRLIEMHRRLRRDNVATISTGMCRKDVVHVHEKY